MKSIQIKLKLNPRQKKIINGWIDTSRAIYNKTLKYIKDGAKINFISLRDKLVTYETKKEDDVYIKYSQKIAKYKKELKNLKNEEEINNMKEKIKKKEKKFKEIKKNIKSVINKNINEWELNTPKETRAAAVNDVCKAYKSTFANFKKGNIKYFEMKYKKKNEKQQTILLQKNMIKNNNGILEIMPGYFEKDDCLFEMGKRTKKKYKNLEIEHDVRLTRKNKDYWLSIPYKIELKKREKIKEYNYCGIDPGIRSFMTVVDMNGYSEYNQNQDKISEINRKKEDVLNRKINNKRRLLLRLEERKKNLVNELHWKTINDLIKRYDVIYYGDIKSHNITNGGKNPKLNQDFNDLKFYQFKSKLEYKCKINNKILIKVNEAYTTKTCSCCGNIYDIGDSKIYNCENNKCKIVCDRDVNSGRNILMKGLLTHLKTE
jgi:putative transposase